MLHYYDVTKTKEIKLNNACHMIILYYNSLQISVVMRLAFWIRCPLVVGFF